MSKRIRTNARIYRGVETPRVDAPPSDYNGMGEQGLVTCPDCGIRVRVCRAVFTDREAGITNKKSIVIGKHRAGGGRVRTADVACRGSLKKVW